VPTRRAELTAGQRLRDIPLVAVFVADERDQGATQRLTCWAGSTVFFFQYPLT
jgi:hypothetical protein